jgi:glycosyltransferase involved in cell wall biosynthesis
VRLLFVVQRYGHEVAGGAEASCREFATRMARRGHDVSVVTSCARSYVDWADAYEPGTSELDGVSVHRLPVERPRDSRLFDALDARVTATPTYTPPHLEREWMRMQGPRLRGYEAWLTREAPTFDAAVFFTYLYWTSWAGLAAMPAGMPTVLHPTAHDEAPLYLHLFDEVYRRPSAFAFLAEEEEALVRRRFRAGQPAVVVGVGTETGAGGDAGAFREASGLGDRPYLLYLGRIDVGKATDELLGWFRAFADRNETDLSVVLMGEAVQPVEPHPDILVTGFVDESMKRDALAGALAVVQPSYFESFSIVLTEAWAQGRPALVQGRCAVLDGQVRRSGGGLAYRGFAEFETALLMLAEDATLCDVLGARGRRHVEEHYTWDAVLDRYEAFLERVTG